MSYLYHVTFLHNLSSIIENGLQPGGGQNFGEGYAGYSRGRLFLTEGAGVSYWVNRLEQVANDQTDNPEEGWIPIVLRFELPDDLLIRPDKIGTTDAMAAAYETSETIPAELLDVWTSEVWDPIEEVDPEDMLEVALEAGEWEEEDFYPDFDVFLPPDEELESPMKNPGRAIVMWHGAQDWSGPPELQSAGKGKSEYGSGLYLTTGEATARKHARGGGQVFRFEIDPDLVWIDGVRIPLDDALDFINSRPRLKHRKEIEKDLIRSAGRLDGEEVTAGALSNLMHYYGALTGAHGPALARFYVDHGIDAELVRQSMEDWIVLFNLDKVIRWEQVPAGKVYDLPRVKEQLT